MFEIKSDGQNNIVKRAEIRQMPLYYTLSQISIVVWINMLIASCTYKQIDWAVLKH